MATKPKRPLARPVTKSQPAKMTRKQISGTAKMTRTPISAKQTSASNTARKSAVKTASTISGTAKKTGRATTSAARRAKTQNTLDTWHIRNGKNGLEKTGYAGLSKGKTATKGRSQKAQGIGGTSLTYKKKKK